MSIIFKPEVKTVRHGRVILLPGLPLGFEDPDAEAYFVSLGWADYSKDTPVFVYDQESVSVDPEAVIGTGTNKGQKVLPSKE